MNKNLSFQIIKKDIGVLTIDRAREMNVLNLETVMELKDFIEELPQKDIKVLIITGAGSKAFVAGADIKQMKEMSKEEFRQYCEISHSNFNMLQNIKIPVIAAINGYALGGGCELALACDIRVVSDSAKLGFPEVKLGLFPCWGGSQRSTRIMSTGKVKELIFTGDMIDAKEAERIGLADRIVQREELMDEVIRIAEKITMNSPNAVAFAKKSVNDGSEKELNEALVMELQMGVECFDSRERIEGMSAFLEKRKPEFKSG